MRRELPVVVIGAGPQGLAAAAHLLERGLEPLVLEAGSEPAAAVREWSHVRLFSPWPELVDKAAARLLAPTGWTAPRSGYPTGGEWVDRYLAPLAAALGDRARYRARVVAVSRLGRDRLVSAGRADQPFTVRVAGPGGDYRVEAGAVIDASGTWATPGPAGGDGLPSIGEPAAADLGLVSYRPPSPAEVAELSGRHVVVIGSGHSAMTAVIDLAGSARVTWVLRRGQVGSALGGGAAYALPRRGALGQAARAAIQQGRARLVTGFRTAAIEVHGDAAVVVSEDGRRLEPADQIVALTGFRPDPSFLSEVRIDLDPVLAAPRALAGEIDPNVHSCGTVRPHGAGELAQPEQDLFIVGMKSYGRAPTFLALTGYEQVRSVAAALAGDHESAGRVELTLPETGVCGGSGVLDQPETDGGQADGDEADGDEADGGQGCGSAPAKVVLTAAPRLVSAGSRHE